MSRNHRPRLYRQIAKKVESIDLHLAVAEAVVAVVAKNEVPQVLQAHLHRHLILEKGQEEVLLLKDLKVYLQRDQEKGVNHDLIQEKDLRMTTTEMNSKRKKVAKNHPVTVMMNRLVKRRETCQSITYSTMTI